METMELMKKFWTGKSVFLTGHTGFKGSWLSLWLTSLGAKVTGYALTPNTTPALYDVCNIEHKIYKSVIGDIRNLNSLSEAMMEAKPDIVIHMAAQPLVRLSYEQPIETYSINVMGTVNLFEAVRRTPAVRAVVNVTTDKCYENYEWDWGYRETDRLGGYDPYSNSKACSELVTSTYRTSFFNINNYEQHNVAIASARAGNVIGGGDWAKDRLIPDCIKAIINQDEIIIRNPYSIRPWQHVLEPLSGYLLLAQKLFEEGPKYAEGWNFGPKDEDAKPVEWIVKKLCEKWDYSITYRIENTSHSHEASYLKLDCSKAHNQLNWQPKWSLDTALEKILEWTRVYQNNGNLYAITEKQIIEYMSK